MADIFMAGPSADQDLVSSSARSKAQDPGVRAIPRQYLRAVGQEDRIYTRRAEDHALSVAASDGRLRVGIAGSLRGVTYSLGQDGAPSAAGHLRDGVVRAVRELPPETSPRARQPQHSERLKPGGDGSEPHSTQVPCRTTGALTTSGSMRRQPGHRARSAAYESDSLVRSVFA
jgi:hypothetical protein